MARNWGRTAILGATLVALLTACESSGGTATPESGAADGDTTTAAPAELQLPCQPGSGRAVTSTGPMNLTDLSGEDLSCAVFDGLTMNQVNLSGSKLPGAKVQSSTLNRVDFSEADLTGAVFENSTLNVPDFTKADLRGARLADAHLNSPVWMDATCPDGTPAGRSCDGHLDPLPVADGPAASAPDETTTTTTAPAPPADTTTPAPAGPTAPSVFNSPAHGDYSCTGGSVSVNGAGSDLHLTGECDIVIVNGAGSRVEIDAANRILVNGAKADVTYHGNPQVLVNGAGATANPA